MAGKRAVPEQPGALAMKWTPEQDGELRRLYGSTPAVQIAAAMGRTRKAVVNRAYVLDIGFRPSWTDEEVAKLKAAYTGVTSSDQIGLDALAQSLGRLKSNVCRKARELGLTDIARKGKVQRKVRPRKYATDEELRKAMSERAKRMIREKGHPRGSLGMKHSPETLEVMSAKSKARWRAMTVEQKREQVVKAAKTRSAKGIVLGRARRGRWYAGWREIGGKRCYFRSRWEANYARYLQWLKEMGEIADWEHEAHTFWFEGIRRGAVSYLPDFKVTNLGAGHEWHEVKGWMDSRSATVIKRMAKYHPKEKLVVIRDKQYREIRSKVAGMIPGWEDEAKRKDWQAWSSE